MNNNKTEYTISKPSDQFCRFNKKSQSFCQRFGNIGVACVSLSLMLISHLTYLSQLAQRIEILRSVKFLVFSGTLRQYLSEYESNKRVFLLRIDITSI